MASIDCIVDTNPMAQEISTVSTQIKGTTAAVIGMQAAVIQAEAEAATKVCNNVNQGFYTLIHSQISQKIAKLQSDVDSHVMKLNQLRKQLLSIKSRMERDYGMISSRYLKLFTGLNRNLEQRIYELDRPTINFAVKDINTISNRSKILTATVPVSQLESLSLSQKIIASNLKDKGSKVIEAMSQFLSDTKKQKELTNKILLANRTDKEKSSILIPVIICESNTDKYGNKGTEISTPFSVSAPQTSNVIKNYVASEINNLVWQDEMMSDEIKSEFSKLLATSVSSDRVKDMANHLFASNNYQTINTYDHELQ